MKNIWEIVVLIKDKLIELIAKIPVTGNKLVVADADLKASVDAVKAATPGEVKDSFNLYSYSIEFLGTVEKHALAFIQNCTSSALLLAGVQTNTEDGWFWKLIYLLPGGVSLGRYVRAVKLGATAVLNGLVVNTPGANAIDDIPVTLVNATYYIVSLSTKVASRVTLTNANVIRNTAITDGATFGLPAKTHKFLILTTNTAVNIRLTCEGATASGITDANKTKNVKIYTMTNTDMDELIGHLTEPAVA